MILPIANQENVAQLDRLDVIRSWVGDSRPWLTSFLESAHKDDSIVAIVAMGSAVRKKVHRRSDFDLLVLHRGQRPKIKAPLEVDIRLYPVQKAEEMLSRGHEVICWAIKFGYAIFDPNGAWNSLKEAWLDRVPLPSAEEAMKRGEKSLQRAKEMLASGDVSASTDLVLSALTQFVRRKLINYGVYPASRPELPDQLRSVLPNDALAELLHDAMYSEVSAREIISRLESIAD